LTPFRFITLNAAIGLMIVIMSLLLLFSINVNAAFLSSDVENSAQILSVPTRSNDHTHPPRVITNNSVVPDISEQFLREVFSGKMRYWPDGQAITVVVLDHNSPLHQSFIQLRLRMFPYQVQRIWNKRIYSGRADPPIVVNDINAMRNTVVNTPGAIGYLPFSAGQ